MSIAKAVRELYRQSKQGWKSDYQGGDRHMGTKGVLFYMATCDECGIMANEYDVSVEFTFWEPSASYNAEMVDFIEIDGELLCPNCQEESDD